MAILNMNLLVCQRVVDKKKVVIWIMIIHALFLFSLKDIKVINQKHIGIDMNEWLLAMIWIDELVIFDIDVNQWLFTHGLILIVKC